MSKHTSTRILLVPFQIGDGDSASGFHPNEGENPLLLYTVVIGVDVSSADKVLALVNPILTLNPDAAGEPRDVKLKAKLLIDPDEAPAAESSEARYRYCIRPSS